MKKNMNKVLVIALAVALLAMSIVAGTLAYLISTPRSITNTFTVGDAVVITLTETETKGAAETVTERNIKYMPGQSGIHKDPTITVDGEDCWVFAGVKVSDGISTYISYTIDSKWTQIATLADGTEIYKTNAVSKKNDTLNILTNDQVDFLDVSTLPGTAPTMTFTGYAIQSTGFATADAAWTALADQLKLSVKS